MNQWNGDELARIGSADELEVAAFRRDGSVRDPVTICSHARGACDWAK